MTTTRILTTGVVALALAGTCSAQSLTEIVKREKERRAKLSGVHADEYTNSDLPTKDAGTDDGTTGVREAPKSGSRQAQSTGHKTPERATHDEGYWRSRAARLRQRVSAAEAKVAELEQQLRRAGGFVPGPLPGACTEGHLVTNLGLTKDIHRICDGNVLNAQEGQRVHAALERAQAALERAKADLEALPEEARKAGALPGWVR